MKSNCDAQFGYKSQMDSQLRLITMPHKNELNVQVPNFLRSVLETDTFAFVAFLNENGKIHFRVYNRNMMNKLLFLIHRREAVMMLWPFNNCL